MNQVAANRSNYLAPGVFQTLNAAEVENAVFGSKFVFACEELKLATIWGVKACLLIFYNRMT